MYMCVYTQHTHTHIQISNRYNRDLKQIKKKKEKKNEKCIV